MANKLLDLNILVKNGKSVTTENDLWTKPFFSIAFINLFVITGQNMMTTGLPVFVASLGAKDNLIGLVTTLFTIAALTIRPFSGMILDRFGRKGILTTGILALLIVTISYAFFPIIGIILAIRFLTGMAWGISSTAVTTIAADIVPRHRFAEGMGYFAIFTSGGLAAAPALSLAILENHSISLMVAVASAVIFLALLLSFFQKTDEIKPVNIKKSLAVSDLFDRRALFPAIIGFMIASAFGSISTFIALLGQSRGVTNVWIYFACYAIVTVLTRPSIGKIIDKNGFFMPGIFSIINIFLTLVIIGLAHSFLVFAIAGIFAGLGIGTGIGTIQTMAVSSVSPNRRGVSTSTFYFGFDAGIGAGAAIAGILATAVGYGNMYFTMTVFPIIALILFLVMGKERIASYTYKE
jgi:MFS family permease